MKGTIDTICQIVYELDRLLWADQGIISICNNKIYKSILQMQPGFKVSSTYRAYSSYYPNRAVNL